MRRSSWRANSAWSAPWCASAPRQAPPTLVAMRHGPARKRGSSPRSRTCCCPRRIATPMPRGVRHGGMLVPVQVGLDQADQAADILEDAGAVDLDQQEEGWREGGWTGRDAGAPAAAAPLAARRRGSSRRSRSATKLPTASKPCAKTCARPRSRSRTPPRGRAPQRPARPAPSRGGPDNCRVVPQAKQSQGRRGSAAMRAGHGTSSAQVSKT